MAPSFMSKKGGSTGSKNALQSSNTTISSGSTPQFDNRALEPQPVVNSSQQTIKPQNGQMERRLQQLESSLQSLEQDVQKSCKPLQSQIQQLQTVMEEDAFFDELDEDSDGNSPQKRQIHVEPDGVPALLARSQERNARLNEKLAARERRIELLERQAQLSALQQQQASESIGMLTEMVQIMKHRQIPFLKEALSDCQQQFSDSQQQCLQLSMKNTQHQVESASKQRLVNESVERVESLESVINEKDKQIAHLNSLLEQKSTQVSHHQSSYEAQISQFQKQLHEAQQSLQKESQEWQQDRDKQKASITQLQAKHAEELQQAEAQMEELEDEMDQLVNNNDQLMNHVQVLEQQLKLAGDNHRDTLQKFKNCLEVASYKLAATEVSLSEEKSHVSSLEAELLQKEEENQELQHELSALEEQLQASQKCIEEFQQEWNQYQKELAELKQKLQAKDGDFQEQSRDWQAALEEKQDEIQKLQDELQELRETTSRKTASILNNHKLELEFKDHLLDSIEDKLLHAERELAAFQSGSDPRNSQEVEQLKEEFENVKTELENKTQELMELQESFEDLHTSLEQKSKEIEQLENSLEQEKATFQQSLDENAQEHSRLETSWQEDSNKKDTQIVELKNKMRDQYKQLDELLQIHHSLEQDHQKLRNSYEEVSPKMEMQDKKILDLEKELLESKTALSVWQAAKQSIQIEIDNLKRRHLEERQALLEDNESTLQNYNSRIAVLENDLRTIDHEHQQEMSRLLEEHTHYNRSLESEIIQLQKTTLLKREHDRAMDQWRGEKITLKSQLERTTTQLTRTKKALEETAQKLAEVELEMETNTLPLQEHDAVTNELREQIHALEDELKQTKESTVSWIEQERQLKEAHEDDIRKARQEQNRLREEWKASKDALTEKKDRIREMTRLLEEVNDEREVLNRQVEELLTAQRTYNEAAERSEEIEELGLKIEELTLENEALLAKQQEMADCMREMEMSNKANEEQVSLLTKRLAELETLDKDPVNLSQRSGEGDNPDQNNNLEILEKENKRLHDQLIDQETKLLSIQEELQLRRAKSVDDMQTFQDAKAIKDAERDLEICQHRLQYANDTIQELEAKVSAANNTIRDLESKLEEKEKLIDSIKQEKEALLENVARLESDLKNLQEDREDLQAQLVTSERALEECDQKRQEWESEYIRITQNKDASALFAHREIDRLKKEIKELSYTRDEQKERFQIAERQCEELEQEIVQLRKDLETKDEELLAMGDEVVDQLENKDKEWKEKMNEKDKTFRELEKVVSGLKTKLDMSVATKTSLQNYVSTLVHDLKEKEAELITLKTDIAVHYPSVKGNGDVSGTGTLKGRRDAVENLREALNKKKEEIDKLNDTIKEQDSEIKKLKKQISNKIEELESKNEILEESAKEQQNLKEKLASQKEEKNMLKASIEHLRKELEGTEKVNNKLQQEFVEARRMCGKLEAKISELEWEKKQQDENNMMTIPSATQAIPLRRSASTPAVPPQKYAKDQDQIMDDIPKTPGRMQNPLAPINPNFRKNIMGSATPGAIPIKQPLHQSSTTGSQVQVTNVSNEEKLAALRRNWESIKKEKENEVAEQARARSRSRGPAHTRARTPTHTRALTPTNTRARTPTNTRARTPTHTRAITATPDFVEVTEMKHNIMEMEEDEDDYSLAKSRRHRRDYSHLRMVSPDK